MLKILFSCTNVQIKLNSLIINISVIVATVTIIKGEVLFKEVPA